MGLSQELLFPTSVIILCGRGRLQIKTAAVSQSHPLISLTSWEGALCLTKTWVFFRSPVPWTELIVYCSALWGEISTLAWAWVTRGRLQQISPLSLHGQTDIASSDFRYYGDHAFQKPLTQFLQYKWMVRKSYRDNRQWLGTLYVLLYKKRTAGMKVSLRSSRQEQISNAYSMPNYHRMTPYCQSKINIITVQEYNSNSPVYSSL